MKPALILAMRRLLPAVLSAAGIALVTFTASAESVSGSIQYFECGDNCYLTITTSSDEELTGLCVAESCEPWNLAAEMPEDQVGRRVMVEVEMGQQTDADGNLMGEFPAFTELQFLD